MSNENNAIAAKEFNPPALEMAGTDFSEMEGLQDFLRFQTAQMPQGTAVNFTISTDDPDNPDTSKMITGVIVDHFKTRRFRVDPKDNKSEILCESRDGKIGVGTPGGTCAICPVAKQCKPRYRLYILRENDLFPILLSLPVMSIENVANYIVQSLMPKRLKAYQVITQISLKGGFQSKTSSNTYAKTFFKVSEVLSLEKQKQMEQYSEQIKMLTRRHEIIDDDPEAPTSQVVEAEPIARDLREEESPI